MKCSSCWCSFEPELAWRRFDAEHGVCPDCGQQLEAEARRKEREKGQQEGG